jgi:hypothetical protein
MKQNYIKIAVTACAACMVMASCGEKEDNKDADVYALPPALSKNEIGALLDEVQKAMGSAKKLTFVSSADISINDLKHRYRVERIYDGDAKKHISSSYRAYEGQERLTGFSYVEGEDRYEYSFSPSGGSSLRSVEWFNNLISGVGTATKEIHRPSTNADRYYCPHENTLSVFRSRGYPSPSRAGTGMWLENGKIVVTDTSRSGTDNIDIYRFEIVLTASKLYKHVKFSENISRTDEKRVVDGEQSFTYSATTPALPSGFSKSDFTDRRPEYNGVVRIIWGEGKGESTFWVKQGETLAFPYISDYAPDVAGKEIASCTIDGKTSNAPWSFGDWIHVNKSLTEVSITWKAQ